MYVSLTSCVLCEVQTETLYRTHIIFRLKRLNTFFPHAHETPHAIRVKPSAEASELFTYAVSSRPPQNGVLGVPKYGRRRVLKWD